MFSEVSSSNQKKPLDELPIQPNSKLGSKSPKKSDPNHSNHAKSLSSLITNSSLYKWYNAKSDLQFSSSMHVEHAPNEHSISCLDLPSTEKAESMIIDIRSSTSNAGSQIKKPLETSLELIQFYKSNENISNLNEPEIATEVQKNIKTAWKNSSIPPDSNELAEYLQTQNHQINILQNDLNAKESEIAGLQLQLANHCLPIESKEIELSQQISSLENLIKPLRADYLQRTFLQKNLKRLFKLDSGDPKHSIENFYYMTVNKLTAFAIAVKALDSGLVARSLGWKDKTATRIFSFLEELSYLGGAAGEFFFGAGALIPLVTLPIISGADYIWDKYRHHQKKHEFKRAANHFNGGFESIEKRSQCIAFQLAHLLQMQLRYCTLKGAQKIVDDWLYRLCYNLLKEDNRTDEEIENIVSDLVRIKKGKENKHDIQTYAENRNWNTLALFNKSGIAYYYNNQLIYESCYAEAPEHKTKKITRAKKYGYLIFAKHEEAMGYKAAITEELQKKYKKDGKVVIWKQNMKPLGPQIHAEDSFHITSPTLVPAKCLIDSVPPSPDYSSDNSLSQPSPRIVQLATKVKDLEDLNGRLNTNLKEQTEKLHLMEENVKMLMEMVPKNNNHAFLE
jgi:hypothetical protein